MAYSAYSVPKRPARLNPFVPPHRRLFPSPKRSPKPKHQPYVPPHLRVTYDYASCQWSEIPPYKPTIRPSPLPRYYHVLASYHMRKPSRQPISKRVTFWDIENGYEGSDERGFITKKVRKNCIVVEASISPPHSIWEEHVAALQACQQELRQVRGQWEEWKKAPFCHDQEQYLTKTSKDAPLFDPMGDSIMATDQHLIEHENEVEAAEISAEKSVSSAPSLGLKMAHKVKKNRIVVAAPFISPVGGAIISPVQQQIDKGMEEEISKEMACMRTHLHDMVPNCLRHDAARIDPLGSTIIANDQHMFESNIGSPMAEISEKQEEPSLGLQNAMRCLELQRKIWDMGSSLSIIPTVPLLHFRDPFLVKEARPIYVRKFVYGPLDARKGKEMETWEFCVSQRGSSHLATWAAFSPSKQGAALLGYWFSQWRPPELSMKKNLVRWFLLLRDAWSAFSRPPDLRCSPSSFPSSMGLRHCVIWAPPYGFKNLALAHF